MAHPGETRRVDAVTWISVGVGALMVVLVAWILVAGGQPADPLAARVTAALQRQEGREVSVYRCEGAGGIWAAQDAVPFRCQVFVAGRRAGEGVGTVDAARGRWALYYEYAALGDGHRHCGSVSGSLLPEVTALAATE